MYIHSSSSIYLRATSFRAYVMVKNCAYLVYPEIAINIPRSRRFSLFYASIKDLTASFDRMVYIIANTNIPFKIYLNFQILITGNVNYILVQTSVADLLKYMLMGTTNKIPWLFPDFDSKIQTSLISNKIPLFPDSDRLKFPWLLPDCGNLELIIHGNLEFIIHVRKRGPWLQYNQSLKLVPFLYGS